ncbi:DUF2207 domain-containing protein [Ruania zhangjianzhongii]|uniref:DUF2207 domain-containing protein n=1 Tax=Ruania zhangjianzhongii TaxID=2603206 RepID=UPI0011C82A25|nr:DUF2207 domain-containing protein [Ruania zhangjianzhongii]
MQRLRILGRTLLALGLLTGVALVLQVAGAPPAHADADDWAITRYDVQAQADADGTVQVQLDFDFDFGDEEGHGPYLTFVTRQEIEGDPDHYRVLEYSDITANSPSGAPADVREEEESGGLAVYIGDEDVDVEGVQHYRVSYTVTGIPTPGVGADGTDEIYWNVVGSGWDVPLQNVTVSLAGPADVLDVACFTGGVGSGRSCEQHAASGPVATFGQQQLDDGEGMSIVAAFPPETFAGVEPILVERTTWGSFMGWAGPAGIVAALIALIGGGGAIWRARTRGRDRAYLGLTPGLFPTSPAAEQTGPARRRPVAVQFTPPEGVRPGVAGTLLDEVANTHDVTATIVDLAVRGYLTIVEREPEKDGAAKEWDLRRSTDPERSDWTGLAPFEETVLRALFPGSEPQVEMKTAGKSLAESMSQVQAELYDRVMERKWFTASPQRVRRRWASWGAVALLLGIALTFLLGLTLGLGVVGVAVALVGIVVMFAALAAPARTAAGTAVLAQTLGFKKYLETAEVNQLKFEEENDIFSRYLPYAIAFGAAKHWTTVFADAAAQGYPVATPTWYVGTAAFWSTGGFDGFTEFTSGGGLTTVASGGSGFSGGSVGGGVGGGGGGGW